MAQKKLTNTELAAFAGQMALVLQAGIPAIEGITLMRDDAETESDQKLLGQILDGMTATGELWRALEETGLYPNYMIQMTRIGEQTGNLDSVMEALDEHYTREEEVRRSTTNAVLYPAILTAVMIAVVLVLMIYVMPVFQSVFRELGSEMTGLPLALLRIGNGIRTYYVSALLILAAVLILVFVSNLTPQGKQFWHRFGRHFRSIRKGYEDTAACRFASAMSISLASGLTPEESLDLSADLNEDPDFREKLKKVQDEVNSGEPLTDCLYQNGIFTGMYAHMASLGAKAGKLDQVLGRIADLYQDEVDTRLNNRLAVIEPTLVIILSLVVGAILLSVMFPLLGILSSL